MKENRTFDEVFGDVLRTANSQVLGVPILARFGGNGYACFIPVTQVATTAAEQCDGSAYGSGLTPVHFYDSLCFAGDELLSFGDNRTFVGSALIPRRKRSTGPSTSIGLFAFSVTSPTPGCCRF